MIYRNDKKKNLDYSFTEIFLICAYIICWLSISTSYQDIINVYKHQLFDFNNIINSTRQILNVLLFPILSILFLKNYKNVFFSNEIIFIFSFFYFLFQLPGLFFTENTLLNSCYIISAFNILLIFILANIYFKKDNHIVFVKISLLMLIIISVLNYKTIINFFSVAEGYTLYTFFGSNENFFGKQGPRSTGSSRAYLFIFIIALIIFQKFFKKNYIVKNIFYILIASLVLLFQSRTTLVLLLVYLLLNFYFKKDFSFKAWRKFIVISFIIPIILVYTLLLIKNVAYNENFLITNQPISKKLSEVNQKSIRPFDPITYSSGRFNDWNLIINKIDGSIIYGYGSQGDRHLIQQTASNGLLYALSSSGVTGLLFFILMSLTYFFVFCKNFSLSLRKNNTEEFNVSILIFLILLRSILESSYAVFSVDFIIIYTLANYLNKKNLNLKK